MSLPGFSRSRDFPTLDDQTYLNTAAEGIPPQVVLEALAQYGQDKLLGMDGRIPHEQQRNEVLQQTARAYGLSPEEIGVCSCSSEAYNLLALAMELVPGDEVIVNDLDFPTGITPWLQPTCAATVRVWKSRQGALRVEDLIPLLNRQTRLLTVSLVSFYNGFMIPLRHMIDAIRRHSSALIALDVTQALGRVPLDTTDVDVIISSTHKWILASHGGGLVGVRNRCADRLTARAGGWYHLHNAFDADRLDRVVTRPGAASFSVGMPNYPAIYAISAALKYLHGLGIDAIHHSTQHLVQACWEGLQQLDIEMLTPNEPDAWAGILAFRHPQADRIHRRLHEQRIHIMHQAGRLRVAIHFYNTMDDVHRFLLALQQALQES